MMKTNLMLEGEEVDEEGLDAKSLYLGGKGGRTIQGLGDFIIFHFVATFNHPYLNIINNVNFKLTK